MFSDAIEALFNDVDLLATRVVALPQIILVLGGPAKVTCTDPNQSNRHVFLTEMFRINDPLADILKMPEDYPAWNQFDGYPNLVEFEKDAGSLSKAILLFSESFGAIAELSNFANDPILRDRLVAVFSKKHYQQDSYIKLGPIKQIEDLYENSICVVSADSPSDFISEVNDVAVALKAKCDLNPRTTKFDLTQRRDRFLLMADLVDLFSALSIKDFQNIFEKLSITSDKKTLERELKLLEMFGLIVSSTSDRKFFIAPKGSLRQSFLDYKAKVGSTSFDRSRRKTHFFELLRADRPRHKAYQFVHEVTPT